MNSKKKKLIAVMVLLFTVMNCYAVDTIFLKSGKSIIAIVMEIGQREIKYKKADNVDGPTYSVYIADIAKIVYENGSEDIFTSNKVEEYYSMKDSFVVSINPLGFVQFGPIINIEYGIADSLILNAHIRLLSLGVLSYLILYDEGVPEVINGVAVGGGAIKFLTETRNSPYFGGMAEYHHTVAEYDDDDWEAENNLAVIAINGGYRFRFENDFYINTGGLLGAALGQYKWYYASDPDDIEGSNDFTITPYGMVEITFGLQL